MPDLKFYSKIFSSIRVHFERMLSTRWVKSVLGIRQGEPSSFQFAHWFYGRCLGLVALMAFLSYWYQADALIGENGIAPWQADLEKVEQFVEESEGEQNKWKLRPTLLWFEPLANIDLLFTIGTISALLLALGFIPLASAFVSYLCYLSLMVVGEPFLSFQWDILLVESLLLSLPFLPATKFHSPFQGLTYSKVGSNPDSSLTGETDAGVGYRKVHLLRLRRFQYMDRWNRTGLSLLDPTDSAWP